MATIVKGTCEVICEVLQPLYTEETWRKTSSDIDIKKYPNCVGTMCYASSECKSFEKYILHEIHLIYLMKKSIFHLS